MTALERRYRRWLMAYPDEYRREHEAELLGTLAEAAAPGQAWPSPREVAALVTGGLRTRARLAGAPVDRVWADGLRWAAILFVGLSAAGMIDISISAMIGPGNLGQAGLVHLEAAVLVLGVVALAAGRYELGLLAPAAAAVIEAVTFASEPWHLAPVSVIDWGLVAALVAVLAWHPRLRRFRRPRSPRGGALALAYVGLAALGFLALGAVSARMAFIDVLAPGFTIPAALLFLLAVVARDPRPALAATVYVAAGLADTAQLLVALSRGPGYATLQYELETLVVLVLVGLAVTVFSARRRIMI